MPTGQYQVLQADLAADREAILGVWERNFPAHDRAGHERRFRWYYQENPWGPARCWLLTSAATGKVVGVAGLGPRRLRLGATTLQAGLASDFAVDREHRSLQPALSLQRAVLASLNDDVDLVYGLPNARSLGIFRRLGYQQVGDLQRWVKVLRVDRYLKNRPWLRRVTPIVNLVRQAASREVWTPRRSLRLVATDVFDDRFDALWQRVGNDELQVVRSPAFLRWRYGQCPFPTYEVLVLQRAASSEALGYVAGYLAADEEWCVVDWLAEPELSPVMLAELVRHARARGAASVSLTGLNTGLDTTLLGRFGFVHRPWSLSLMASTRPGLNLPPEHLARWRFLLVDEDYN